MSVEYPRALAGQIQLAMTDTPVVLINGPRQSGKSTLAMQFSTRAGNQNLPYLTLDDETTFTAAQHDPQGFVARLDRAIIDEVQRLPELMLAIKLAVDRDRRPGRFLLTGSANLLMLPQVSESLAGRIEIFTLLPLSQSELVGTSPDFLQKLREQTWSIQTANHWDEIKCLIGGYPEMNKRPDESRRQAWARTYTKALIERDIQQVSNIEHSQHLAQLLNISAMYAGKLINLTQLGGQVGLDAKTIAKYLNALERLFIVRTVPAWHRNELSRLIKAPKLHFYDAGLQATLAKMTISHLAMQRQKFGATLETWVHAELLKHIALSVEPWFVYHFRDKEKNEVDFVLEDAQSEVYGVEVKAAVSVNSADFKGLRKLREAAGASFKSGIVLYNGKQAIPFGESFWAVPLSCV